MDIELQIRRFNAWAQTQASPKIDLVELAKLVLAAGWTEADAILAVAVAGAESGYRIQAKNVDKRHGQEDYGLFQINEIHRPDMTHVYEPAYNTGMAFKIWKRRHDRGKDGFAAWMAYNAGKHVEFIPAATEAVRQALNS